MTVGLLSQAAHAQNAGRLLLEEMSQNMRQLNYSGTYVYIHDNVVETMRLVHAFDSERGERERITSLNGEAREIFRDATKITCIWPASGNVTVGQSKPRALFPEFDQATLNQLQQQYRFELLGPRRVAGILGTGVYIRPVDSYRYGYELTVSEQERMLLQYATLNDMGKAIEQVVFTELASLAQVDEQMFSPERLLAGRAQSWQREDRRATEASLRAVDASLPWRFDWLPPGFRLIETQPQSVPSVSGGHHAIVSDGMASISVFSEPFAEQSELSPGLLQGGSSMGAIHAYGLRKPGMHVTVVGEVPAKTVEKIAHTIVLP